MYSGSRAARYELIHASFPKMVPSLFNEILVEYRTTGVVPEGFGNPVPAGLAKLAIYWVSLRPVHRRNCGVLLPMKGLSV